jgi:hypothetical protein
MDKRNLVKSNHLNIIKWIEDSSKFVKREAKETSIAYVIFTKMILSFFYKSVDKPSDNEIKFLKLHSKDLIKIMLFIATRPTPIPYVLIIIILKKFGIDLLPLKEDLIIPSSTSSKNSN